MPSSTSFPASRAYERRAKLAIAMPNVAEIGWKQFRAYISEVFGSDLHEATPDWNSVGACIHYFGEDRTIQFRLWERTEGHLGIPEMTFIIIRISSRGPQEVIHAEMTDEDWQPHPINKVPGSRIACIRLWFHLLVLRPTPRQDHPYCQGVLILFISRILVWYKILL